MQTSNLMSYQQDNVDPSIKRRNHHNEDMSFLDSAHAGLDVTYEPEAIVVNHGSINVFKKDEDNNNYDDKSIVYDPSTTRYNTDKRTYIEGQKIHVYYKNGSRLGKEKKAGPTSYHACTVVKDLKNGKVVIEYDSRRGVWDTILETDVMNIMKTQKRESTLELNGGNYKEDGDTLIKKKKKKLLFEEYFAFQDIRDRRVVDGRIELLVKWSHYPESDNSWVHDQILIEDGLGDDIDEWYSLGIKQEVTSSDNDDDDDEAEVPFEVGDDLFM